MVRAVLFDCDGILLDSMNSANQMDMLNKNTLRQTVQYFYTEYRIENRFETLYDYAYSYLLKQYQNNIPARKGILSVIKNLKARVFYSI